MPKEIIESKLKEYEELTLFAKINKFENELDTYGECIYIFKARRLNMDLTAAEAGLSENSNTIFYAPKKKIFFKIQGIMGFDFLFRIPIFSKLLVSKELK